MEKDCECYEEEVQPYRKTDYKPIIYIAENQEPLEITKDLVEIAIKKWKRKKLQIKKNGQMK